MEARGSKYATLKDLKETSPSRHEMDWDMECRRKRTLACFIRDLGQGINVQQIAVATACAYMFQYYRVHSMRKAPGGDRYTIATACLFLAAKVEENAKQLSEFVPYSMALRDVAMSKPEKDPKLRLQTTKDLANRYRKQDTSKAYGKERERILVAERSILHTIGFQLIVHHPYMLLFKPVDKVVNFVLAKDRPKSEEGAHDPNFTAQQKKLKQECMQMCVTFINDSLKAPLCLQFTPETIAYAVTRIVVNLKNLELGKDELKQVLNGALSARWNDASLAMEQILSLYQEALLKDSQSKGLDSKRKSSGASSSNNNIKRLKT